jgi:hypothetical protein
LDRSDRHQQPGRGVDGEAGRQAAVARDAPRHEPALLQTDAPPVGERGPHRRVVVTMGLERAGDLVDPRHERAEERGEAIEHRAGVGRLADRARQRLDPELLVGVASGGHQQAATVGEVAVERLARELGTPRHALERGAARVLAQRLEGDVEDAAARVGGHRPIVVGGAGPVNALRRRARLLLLTMAMSQAAQETALVTSDCYRRYAERTRAAAVVARERAQGRRAIALALREEAKVERPPHDAVRLRQADLADREVEILLQEAGVLDHEAVTADTEADTAESRAHTFIRPDAP